MEQTVLDIIWKYVVIVYKWLVIVFGNFTIITSIVFIIWKLTENYRIKKATKAYAQKIDKSKFFQDMLSKMTDEEKEKLEKNKKASTKITLDFGSMQTKKETK